MRDKQLDYDSFFRQIDRIAREYSSKIFRDTAPINSKWLLNPDFENDFYLTSRRKEDLVRLAILSWYIPEEYGILIRLRIREEISHNPDLLILDFLTKSLGEMKLFLYHTELWHTRDFFGNILKDNMTFKDLPIRPRMRKKSKPKKVQRHRGYRDKGTLRFPHEYHDFSDRTLEEKQLEDDRKALKDAIDFLEGWIT